MTVQEAITELQPWHLCMVGQVWDVPSFPRVALVALSVGFEISRFRMWGIDALIRLAREPADSERRRQVMRKAKQCY